MYDLVNEHARIVCCKNPSDALPEDSAVNIGT